MKIATRRKGTAFPHCASAKPHWLIERRVGEQWAVSSGQWAVSSGQWAVGSEQWAVAGGRWAVSSEQ